MQLDESDDSSNLICIECKEKISETKTYCDELKANEQRLIDQLKAAKQSQSIEFIDLSEPQIQIPVKKEPEICQITKIHTSYGTPGEITSEHDYESLDEGIQPITEIERESKKRKMPNQPVNNDLAKKMKTSSEPNNNGQKLQPQMTSTERNELAINTSTLQEQIRDFLKGELDKFKNGIMNTITKEITLEVLQQVRDSMSLQPATSGTFTELPSSSQQPQLQNLIKPLFKNARSLEEIFNMRFPLFVVKDFETFCQQLLINNDSNNGFHEEAVSFSLKI